MDKKDLEELKKWELERKQEQIDNLGVDLSKINIKRATKKSRKTVKFLKRVGYLLKYFAITLFVISGIAVSLYLFGMYSSIKLRTDANVKSTLRMRYGISVKVLRQETSGRVNNGKYFLKSKSKPRIEFTAIKDYGNLTDDYTSRLFKYYFELWDSDFKKLFTVEEKLDNDMLSYGIYIENFPDIETAMEAIIKFKHFCNNNRLLYFSPHIKVGNRMIYPYNISGSTDEQAMIDAKKLYESIINNTVENEQ